MRSAVSTVYTYSAQWISIEFPQVSARRSPHRVPSGFAGRESTAADAGAIWASGVDERRPRPTSHNWATIDSTAGALTPRGEMLISLHTLSLDARKPANRRPCRFSGTRLVTSIRQ